MFLLNAYKAYLIDLDGTLLDLSFEEFTRSYYQLLIERFKNFVEPSLFKHALDEGIKAMLQNDGRVTNAEAFYNRFYSIVNGSPEILDPIIEDFYRNDFKSLSRYGRKIEEAAALIELLKKNRKKIVLATNPVFPRIAVEERIRWAGFDPSDFDFIASFETMRACKPNPLFFNQVLELVGVEPDQAVMIGDDPELDLGAAHAGIDVVLIDRKSYRIERTEKVLKVPGIGHMLELLC